MNAREVLAELPDAAARAQFLIACKLCLEHADYSWYDADLLNEYEIAVEFLRLVRPDKLGEFEAAFAAFQASETFEARSFEQFLPAARFAELAAAVSEVCAGDLEEGELERHGRVRSNHHPLFDEIQRELTGWVGEQVGEAVEPSFNLFSRYNASGVLPPHLDSPDSKWAFGICVASKAQWPIHCSATVAWPPVSAKDNWSPEEMKRDPALAFRAFALEPNDALLFCGNCQWHYRERAGAVGRENFDIVYFMYVPKGCRALIKTAGWSAALGIPELASLHAAFKLRRARQLAGGATS